METPTILILVGSVIAFITAVVSMRIVAKKLRARSTLIQRLSRNAVFLSELQHLERIRDSSERLREIERIKGLIDEQLRQLNGPDRERIESSMYQSSPRGRMRYIEKIATDTSRLQHAG